MEFGNNVSHSSIPSGSRVFSMSALQTYERCPKKFEIQYLLGLEDKRDDYGALERGTAFHEHLANFVKHGIAPIGNMSDTALAYIKNNPPPAITDVACITGTSTPSIEESVYLRINKLSFLRCSFDLVYIKQGILTIRDYKTFSRAPSFNIDLDFQGRTYLAVAAKVWPGFAAYRFEHEMVRVEAPGTAHGTKPVKRWTEDECYFHHGMTLSKSEMHEDWRDILAIIKEIECSLPNDVSEDHETSWRRRSQKGGGYLDCGSCGAKNLCIADKQGNLDEGTAREIGQVRDTIWDLPTI